MKKLVRRMQPDEWGLLDDFLYEAIYIPEGTKAPPRAITKQADLQVYIEAFGTRKADCAWVAEVDGVIVGAVWVRIMDDYGHLDDETPSLAISVKAAYRRRGIGRALMEAIISDLREQAYPGISLSVQKTNPAVKLYQTLGFKLFRERGDELILLRRLL